MRKFLLTLFVGLITLLILPNKASASWIFSLSGKYLYWTAHQERMNPMPYKTPKAHYQWNPGFRVGMDLTLLEFLCLKPGIEYTHYQTHGTKKRGVTFDFGQLPTVQSIKEDFFASSSIADPIEKNEVSLSVDYLDLNLFGSSGGIYCISWNWGLGLRSAILKSNWHDFAQFSDVEVAKTKVNWKYYATGAKLNAEFAYDIGCGFKLYQEFTGALLWGHLKRFAKTEITLLDLDKDIDKSRFKSVSVFHSETGIAWSFCCEVCSLLQAKIAFEYSRWFDVGENAFFINSEGMRFKSSCSDLILYGLTAGLALEF